MFGKNKKSKKGTKKGSEGKAPGRPPGRPIFGFPCSPDIPASLKLRADQLHVTEYSLCEHALQLGAIQIAEACKNPEEREELYLHLVEVHIGKRTIEKVARYDEQAADVLRSERIRRFKIDNAVRQLVVKYLGRGHKPEELDELILFAIRCKIAIAGGWQPPPDISRRR